MSEEIQLSGVTLNRDRVQALLRDGKKVQWIADAAGWPRAHVVNAGFEIGLRFDRNNDVMTTGTGLAPAAGIPAPRQPLPQPTKETPTVPNSITAPAAGSRGPVDEASASYVLARTEGFKDKTAQRLRRKVLDAVAELRQWADVVEAEERQRQQADRERQALAAKAEKLRAELADLEAKLGQPAASKKHKKPWPPKPVDGVAPWSQIREWCLTNNVPCSTHGALPRSAVEAFLAAHPDLKAPA